MNETALICGSPEVRASWREPSLAELTDDDLADYTRRKAALIALLDGASPCSVEASTGLRRSVLTRMVARALTVDRSGHAFGFYACLKYYHLKDSVRKRPIEERHALRHRGLSCAFRQVVGSSQELAEFVDGLIEKGNWRPRSQRKKVFERFCRLAHKTIGSNGYPFDAQDGGWRSLFRYLASQTKQCETRYGEPEGVPSIVPMAGDSTGLPSAAASRRIYDEAEFDGWLEPVDMEILIPSRHGVDAAVRIEGIGLLAILERKTTAVLGYLVLFKVSYDSLDAIHCFFNALSEWRPRELVVPVFAYKPGAALPSGVDADAIGRLWNILFADNASVNVGQLAQKALLHHVCCNLNFGRAGEPTARAVVERFFKCVTELHLKSLLSRREAASTGRGRHVEGAIPMQWVEDIFDVICANYNVEKKGSLLKRSPLELLLAELRRDSGAGRTDGSNGAIWRRMLYQRVKLPIKRPKGRSPYILYESAQYTSTRLRQMVREDRTLNVLDCEINLSDLRHLRAWTDNGICAGVLNARPPWSGSAPCDLQTRRLIAKAMRRDGHPIADDNADLHARFANNQLVKGLSSSKAGSVVATMASRGSLPEPAPRQCHVIRAPRGGWIDIDKL